MTDQRVALGAQNNADWYAMMWDIHGLRYTRTADGFRAIDPPPAYHGWAVALPGSDIERLITPVLDQPAFAVKDASGTHDLGHLGLRTLFGATWLWHDAPDTSDISAWVRITTPKALAGWEAAWADTSPTPNRQFPHDILARADVAIWGRQGGEAFDAGFIANLSDGCVGLSNLFGQDARPAATALCAGFGNGKPLVGYERGDDLAEALASGWVATGDLNVWHR